MSLVRWEPIPAVLPAGAVWSTKLFLLLQSILPGRGAKRPLRFVAQGLAVLLCLAGCGTAPDPVAEIPSQPPVPATVQPTSAPTATATPRATPKITVMPAPTPTQTPMPSSTPHLASSPIAFESHRDGNAEIYLLEASGEEWINLTRHSSDDRAPAWRPDGRAIAFESHRDGNWEIYVLELTEGTLTRLTDNPAYDGAPAWSPDGSQIAFESYRDGNLEVYVIAAAGKGPLEGHGRRLTDHPAGDYGPAWSPDGVQIAFTSWRDGQKEVYLVPAAGGEAHNLTQNPADDEDPAWTVDGSALAFVSWRDVDPENGCHNAEIYRVPVGGGEAERLTDHPWPDVDPAWDGEGRLVWSAYEPGPPFETYDPYRPGDYHLYRSSADGPERLTDTDWDDRRPAPAPPRAVSMDEFVADLPPEPATSTPMATWAPGTLARVVEVPSILASFSEQPIRVTELVAPSLVAWQQEVLTAIGFDFLHLTLGAWRSIDQVRKREMYTYDYGYLSWHKAGRALDLALEYKVDGVNQMVLAREDLGGSVIWRMYLPAAAQDGSQGEPLKENPWLYWWHIVPEQEPEAYAAGGKRLPVPAGYYVDITAIAKRHGWERIASYAIEGDYHWHTDSNGTEYWHYERTDGLSWWDAMHQIYPAEMVEEHAGWEAGPSLAQSEEMMRSKGIPEPEP